MFALSDDGCMNVKDNKNEGKAEVGGVVRCCGSTQNIRLFTADQTNQTQMIYWVGEMFI